MSADDTAASPDTDSIDEGDVQAGPEEENLVGAGNAPQPGPGNMSPPGSVDPDAGPVDAEASDTDAVEPEPDRVAELTSDLQRVSAEYANFRKRSAREREGTIENAKASVLTELLVVLDDLDRARKHGDLETGPLRSVADKLNGVFTSQGVTAFGAEGDSFDPSIHEAVQHEGDGHDPVVGSVFRQGYRFKERVLRTAMVAVVDGGGQNGNDAEPPNAESDDASAEN